MTNEEIAAKIIENLGGAENISSAANCMTRLRAQIVDKSKINADALKKIDGVSGIYDAGAEFQIILGPGRATNVTNAVNYYSSEEEVLANGNGIVPDIGRADSWFRQEVTKGRENIPLLTGRNEAGWEFNVAHMTEPVIIYPPPGASGDPTVIEESRLLTPSETTNLTDDVLMANPFFGHFENRNIYASTNGIIVSENAAYRTQLLADAIPAESYAVGANPVPSWSTNGCVNVNMAMEFKDEDQIVKSLNQKWLHSFFIKVPYMCIHEFYENIVSRIPKETDQ